MRIVVFNELKETQYETVFEIPKDRKLIVVSDQELTSRDIRIIQLSLMLDDSILKERITYKELKKNLELLTVLDDREMSYLIRFFKIFDFKTKKHVSILDETAFNILRRNTKNLIKLYYIKNPFEENEINNIRTSKIVNKGTYYAFKKSNILTIGDLLKYSKQELLEIKGIGETTVKDIENYLEMIGLGLKED